MKRRQKIKNGNGWPLSRVVRWADRAARVARVAKGWQHFSLKTALILNYQVGTRFWNPLPPLATWTKQTADADAELRKTEALCNGNETSIKVAHRAAPRQRIRRRSILRAWENGCLEALVSWQPVSLLLSLLLPEHIALVLGNLETLLWRAAGTLVRLPQGLRAYFVSFYCLIVISHMGNGKFNWLRWSITLPAPQRRFIRKGAAGEGPQWQTNWAQEQQRFCFTSLKFWYI